MMKERVKPSHVLSLLNTVVGVGGGIQWNSELLLFSAANNHPVKFTAAVGGYPDKQFIGIFKKDKGMNINDVSDYVAENKKIQERLVLYYYC